MSVALISDYKNRGLKGPARIDQHNCGRRVDRLNLWCKRPFVKRFDDQTPIFESQFADGRLGIYTVLQWETFVCEHIEQRLGTGCEGTE
jgi:hypothetical protein